MRFFFFSMLHSLVERARRGANVALLPQHVRTCGAASSPPRKKESAGRWVARPSIAGPTFLFFFSLDARPEWRGARARPRSALCEAAGGRSAAARAAHFVFSPASARTRAQPRVAANDETRSPHAAGRLGLNTQVRGGATGLTRARPGRARVGGCGHSPSRCPTGEWRAPRREKRKLGPAGVCVCAHTDTHTLPPAPLSAVGPVHTHPRTRVETVVGLAPRDAGRPLLPSCLAAKPTSEPLPEARRPALVAGHTRPRGLPRTRQSHKRRPGWRAGRGGVVPPRRCAAFRFSLPRPPPRHSFPRLADTLPLPFPSNTHAHTHTPQPLPFVCMAA
jgi:hypothetical protein